MFQKLTIIPPDGSKNGIFFYWQLQEWKLPLTSHSSTTYCIQCSLHYMKKAVFSFLPFKQLQPDRPQQWLSWKDWGKTWIPHIQYKLCTTLYLFVLDLMMATWWPKHVVHFDAYMVNKYTLLCWRTNLYSILYSTPGCLLRVLMNTSVSISGLLTHIRNQGLPNINQQC